MVADIKKDPGLSSPTTTVGPSPHRPPSSLEALKVEPLVTGTPWMTETLSGIHSLELRLRATGLLVLVWKQSRLQTHRGVYEVGLLSANAFIGIEQRRPLLLCCSVECDALTHRLDDSHANISELELHSDTDRTNPQGKAGPRCLRSQKQRGLLRSPHR